MTSKIAYNNNDKYTEYTNITFLTGISLHTAGARELWIDQSAFSGREKF